MTETNSTGSLEVVRSQEMLFVTAAISILWYSWQWIASQARLW